MMSAHEKAKAANVCEEALALFWKRIRLEYPNAGHSERSLQSAMDMTQFARRAVEDWARNEQEGL